MKTRTRNRKPGIGKRERDDARRTTHDARSPASHLSISRDFEIEIDQEIPHELELRELGGAGELHGYVVAEGAVVGFTLHGEED